MHCRSQRSVRDKLSAHGTDHNGLLPQHLRLRLRLLTSLALLYAQCSQPIGVARFLGGANEPVQLEVIEIFGWRGDVECIAVQHIGGATNTRYAVSKWRKKFRARNSPLSRCVTHRF